MMGEPLLPLEEVLVPLAAATRLLLESLSVLTVLYGLLATIRQFLPRLGRSLPERPSNRARLTFASWLALALEFQLGVVAVIRTFLNLFLGREIEAEQRIEREAAGGSAAPQGR
jgi:uncharacterized membrane protein